MESEKTIGKALHYLTHEKAYEREEMFITTKHGYLPEDYEQQISGKQIIESIYSIKIYMTKRLKTLYLINIVYIQSFWSTH
jgi:aryl-alcohol dehydrogenase-like predicted oxidoreductase